MFSNGVTGVGREDDTGLVFGYLRCLMVLDVQYLTPLPALFGQEQRGFLLLFRAGVPQKSFASCLSHWPSWKFLAQNVIGAVLHVTRSQWRLVQSHGGPEEPQASPSTGT